MSDTAENKLVTTLIIEIRTKLEEAVTIAKAAESCAINGSINRAVPILTEFEDLAHEAQDLLRATLTIKRNLLSEIR
jgi:hypothetical protein